MIVTRSINGAELDIKLTPEEVREAYLEHQKELDKEDVLSVLEGLSDGELYDKFCRSREEIYKKLDLIVTEYRKIRCNTEESWEDFVDMAVGEAFDQK